ncbi:MAG: recombinase family protein, partial [Candidatus Margulisiibacteriota bacterium]
MTEKQTQVVSYSRVSTVNQKDEGTIQLQLNEIRDYCLENKLELIEAFNDDGVSGGLKSRPALVNLLNYLEANPKIEAIVIFKLDRLARDLYIQEHLIKKFELLGKRLISIKEPNLDSGDPMRKAFRQFMGIISELEKAFITMRLSGGRMNKAKKGLYSGGAVPFGYSSQSKELSINDQNSVTIKKIFYLKRYKKLSLYKIASYLNENDYRTARGGKWNASSIRYILQNKIYKGTLEYMTETT